MEVLVRRLREVVLIHYARTHAHFVHDHFVVKLVSVAPIRSQIIANQILLVTISHAALREIVVLADNITCSKNLWPGTKVLLMILREVINRSLVLVQSTQILVVV